jgi:hypothetical protein
MVLPLYYLSVQQNYKQITDAWSPSLSRYNSNAIFLIREGSLIMLARYFEYIMLFSLSIAE